MDSIKIVRMANAKYLTSKDLIDVIHGDTMIGNFSGYALKLPNGNTVVDKRTSYTVIFLKPIQLVKNNIFCSADKIVKVQSDGSACVEVLDGEDYKFFENKGKIFYKENCKAFPFYVDDNGHTYNVKGGKYLFSLVEEGECAEDMGMLKLRSYYNQTDYHTYYLDVNTQYLFNTKEWELLKTLKQSPKTILYIHSSVFDSEQFSSKCVEILEEHINSIESPEKRNTVINLFSLNLNGEIKRQFDKKFGLEKKNSHKVSLDGGMEK